MSDLNFSGSINVGELKKELEANKAKADKSKKQKWFWKPSSPETTVRIVPYRHGPNPFNELFFHYDIKNKDGFGMTIVCPKHTHGKADCPFCDHVKELYKSPLEQDRKKANSIRAKNRFYIPIINKTDISKGAEAKPMFWGIPPKTREAILKFVMMEDDYGDIAHQEHGNDLIVQWQEKTKEKPYGEVTVIAKPKKTPMLSDKEIASKVYNEVPNVHDLFPEYSYEELKSILEEYKDTIAVSNSGAYTADDAIENEIGDEHQSLKDKLAAIAAEE